MARVTMIAFALLGLFIAQATATAVGNCWFADESQVSGIITLQQASPTDPVTITGNLTTTTVDLPLSFHLQTYGDLYDGGQLGGCMGTDASFTVTPDVLQHYTFSTSSSLITLFGNWSIIGRSFGVYENESSCATAVSGTRLATCVIGISIQNGLANQANQTLSALPVGAVAAVHLSNGTITGYVTFAPNQLNGEVLVHTHVWGLSPYSIHGLHVHWYGDMTWNDGNTMGGHLNPLGMVHGIAPSLQRHMGDIGNVTADENGVVDTIGSYNLLNFNGVGNIIGRGLIFHALRDDGNIERSNTSVGTAGARFGRGVIGITSRRPSALNPANAQCWFAPGGQVTGMIGLQQLSSTSALMVSGNLAVSGSPSSYSLHVNTYGDLKDGTNAGGCFNGDTALQTFTSGSVFNGISKEFHIWGNGGIIGRTISVYSGTDTCSNSVSLTPLGQCVVGISSVGATTNKAVQTLSTDPVGAYCRLQAGPAAPAGLRGEVHFAPSTSVDGEVYVYTYVSGVAPYSVHGLHVHWYGDMSTADGLSMGGHLNPQNLNHGIAPSVQRHMGDIGNVTADGNGIIQVAGSYNLLNFYSTGNIIGRGVVFHAWRDDGNLLNTSISVGDAGARWARCVIGVSSREPPYAPFAVSSTGVAEASSSSATVVSSSTGSTIDGSAAYATAAPAAAVITLLAAMLAIAF